jgi:hypothetical protein
MTAERGTVNGDVLNPVDVERKITETSSRIAAGVKIVTSAEREMKAKKRAFDLAYAYSYKKAEGSIKDREYAADIETMPHREEADNAEIAYKHAVRTADALEKELFAHQAILKSVNAMYGAAGARG